MPAPQIGTNRDFPLASGMFLMQQTTIDPQMSAEELAADLQNIHADGRTKILRFSSLLFLRVFAGNPGGMSFAEAADDRAGLRCRAKSHSSRQTMDQNHICRKMALTILR